MPKQLFCDTMHILNKLHSYNVSLDCLAIWHNYGIITILFVFFPRGTKLFIIYVYIQNINIKTEKNKKISIQSNDEETPVSA